MEIKWQTRRKNEEEKKKRREKTGLRFSCIINSNKRHLIESFRSFKE